MSKGTLLGLAAAVVVLLAVTFYWSGESSDVSSGDEDNVRVARRHSSEERGGNVAAGGREQRQSRHERNTESGGDSAPGNDRMRRDDSGSARRRVPGSTNRADAPGSARRGGGNRGDNVYADATGSRGALANNNGGGGGGISRPRARRDNTDNERPNLPEARDPQPDDGNAVDPGAEAPPVADEPIKEVAYEQDPDRLFDTGVPMEVMGAGRVSPDGGMVSFWIQPEWAHNKEDSADLMRLGESGLSIVKEGSFLRFEYNDASGNEQGGDADIGHWNDGEWHHVIASWTGNAMTLFVDGGQAFQNVGITRPAAGSDPRIFVGSDYPEGQGIALAAMANLTVINKPASVEDVQKMFEAKGPIRK